jgi:RNA polymerase sigma factor (sigma-70 family)
MRQDEAQQAVSSTPAEDWTQLVRSVVRDILGERQFSTSGLRDECILEGLIAVWLALHAADLLPTVDRPRYLAACIRHGVRAFLQREGGHRAFELPELLNEDADDQDSQSSGRTSDVTSGERDPGIAQWDLHDERLRECLVGFSSHVKETLTLRFAEELSYAEIAERLGGAAGTYRVEVARAVAHLRASVATGPKAQPEREREREREREN